MWAAALHDCVGSAMGHFKYPWARTTCDMLVKAAVDRRQNFSEEQQEELQQWNAQCKGQKIVRQQEHQRQKEQATSSMTSYERDEHTWRSAEIAKNKGGGEQIGGLDNWCAKQSNN